MQQQLTVTAFARLFGLSRATLLYYDRIGLLKPAGVNPSGYRLYGAAEKARMDAINVYREAGLSLAEIRDILDGDRGGALETTLEKRLVALDREIRDLHAQQHLIARLLKRDGKRPGYRTLDVERWVAMLEEAGVDEAGLMRWHRAFERDAPQVHQEFLASLGLSEAEIADIRRQSQ